MKQYPADNRDAGTLYLVATPIGNLSDISERAIRTLRDADFIAAEDTRVTRKLIGHLGIKKPLVSYRSRNQREAGSKILDRVRSGLSCALVTDAGTPGISDPGEDLVRLFTDNGMPVVSIPGPCAAITGLSLSGLPAARFVFEGFLPAKQSKRLAHLERLKAETRTIVFYEAPHKIARTMLDVCNVFGKDRRVSVSRELTKIFEETLRMSLGDAAVYYAAQSDLRGEFVIVVEGSHCLPVPDTGINEAAETAIACIADGMSTRDAVKKAALESGCSENKLYKAVIRQKPE